MNIIPAIDLLEGNAVRLKKGVREDVTVFSTEPWTLIEKFAAAGASRIHVVDLDGAFAGERKHHQVIGRMIEQSPVPIQVGGGLRTREAVDALFATGAGFGVLGTAAVKRPEFVAELCQAYPGKIIVAVDAKDGKVAVEGWVETSKFTAIELGQEAASWGAAALLYTDVARDGVHTGPNIAATAALANSVPGTPVIASGGVSTLDDIRDLARAGIPLAVVGRALYDNHFTVEQALEVAAEAAGR